MIPRRALIPLLLCAGLPLLVAQDSCGSGTCADHPPISSGDTTCPVPGYEDRGFDLHLPLAPDPDAPFKWLSGLVEEWRQPLPYACPLPEARSPAPGAGSWAVTRKIE